MTAAAEILLQHELVHRFKNHFITKQALYECMQLIWKELHLFYPFRVCEVMRPLEPFLSVEFREAKNTPLSGLINKNPPPEMSHIFINTAYPLPTRLFSLWHEVMHWFFHPAGIHKSIRKPEAKTIEDYQANEAAAEMMMPYRVFIPWVAEKTGGKPAPDYGLIQKIKNDAVNEFNVSPAIVHYRLESLKYEIKQYMNGADIKSLTFLSNSQQRARGIQARSLNDLEVIGLYTRVKKPGGF